MFEEYGPFALSIIAGDGYYSTPKVDGLPPEGYSHYEVALCQSGPKGETCLNPKDFPVFPEWFRNLFEPIDSPVAPQVSKADLVRMRNFLKALEQNGREP